MSKVFPGFWVMRNGGIVEIYKASASPESFYQFESAMHSYGSNGRLYKSNPEEESEFDLMRPYVEPSKQERVSGETALDRFIAEMDERCKALYAGGVSSFDLRNLAKAIQQTLKGE